MGVFETGFDSFAEFSTSRNDSELNTSGYRSLTLIKSAKVVSESRVGQNVVFVQPAMAANDVPRVSLQPDGVGNIQRLDRESV